MAGRRKGGKGSFGDHVDELVKLFPHEQEPAERSPRKSEADDDSDDPRGGLFERSWRGKRGG